MLRLLMLFALLLGSAAAPAEDFQVREKFATPFADARDAIVMGIESRGLVINYTSHIGEMLQRTGADLGASKRIFVQAEIVEFCSAKLSRQMMEADPHNIVLCPFAISIYTLPGESGVTWVAYRRPPPAVAAIVGPLLADIAAEAGR